MSHETYVIRRGRVEEAAMLASFAERVFVESFGAQNNPDDLALYLREAFGEAQQRRELGDPSRHCLLLECDGVLAAYALLNAEAPHALVSAARPMELQRFYVDAPWHGQGAAAALMRAVLETAQAAGADVLWLGVWEENPRAIRFYEKHGFREVGTHVFVVGTDPQTDRVMAKPLA